MTRLFAPSCAHVQRGKIQPPPEARGGGGAVRCVAGIKCGRRPGPARRVVFWPGGSGAPSAALRGLMDWNGFWG